MNKLLHFTLTLKMTTTQVVEMSVTVNNSLIQCYANPDDGIPPTEELTPGFKPYITPCAWS